MAYKFNPFTGNLDDTGLPVDTDGTLAANSDTKIASQKATKTYVDTKTATLVGTLASRPTSANSGDFYLATDEKNGMLYKYNSTTSAWLPLGEDEIIKEADRLRNARGAIIKSSSTPTSWAALGDSITQGFGDSTYIGYFDRFRRKLMNKYGIVYGKARHEFKTPNPLGLTHTSAVNYGWGLNGLLLGYVDSKVVCPGWTPLYGRRARVYYTQGPSQGKMQIEVKLDTTVVKTEVIDTGNATQLSGRVWDSGDLGSINKVTITVTPVTGGAFNAGYSVIFENYELYADLNGYGIRDFNGGHVGYSTNEYTANLNFADGLDSMNLDGLIIYLGQNDILATSLPTFISQYQTIIDTIKSKLPGTKPVSVVMLGQNPCVEGNRTNVALVKQFNDATRTLAVANGFTFIDLYPILGNPAISDPAGLYVGSTNDGVHPGDKGHELIANAIMDKVYPSDSGDYTPTRLNIGDGLMLDVNNLSSAGIAGQADWTAGTKSIFSDLVVAPGSFGGTQFTRLTTGAVGTVMTSVNFLGNAVPAWGLSGSQVVKAVTAVTNTYTLDVAVANIYTITAPAANFTVTTSGTPTDGQKLVLRLNNGATAYTPTWNSIFLSSGLVSLPTTLTASKINTCYFVYVAARSKWVLMAYDAVGF